MPYVRSACHSRRRSYLIISIKLRAGILFITRLTFTMSATLSISSLAGTPELTIPSSAQHAVEPPLELGETWGPENELQASEIAETVKQLLIRRSEGDGLLRRDAHPKHHGCVKAFVEVNSGMLPNSLRVGIFTQGLRSQYPAWIRFSNGNPDGAKSPDNVKDIRGMALKLMEVEGTQTKTHDFVMLTSKEFIARDGEDYLQLHRALSGSSISLGWYFITHWRNLSLVLAGQKQASNPLHLEYFSSVPYKLGDRSMKFKARPCPSSNIESRIPTNPGPNYLRQRMVSSLQSEDTCYELHVQPNMDPKTNNIERANVSWDEIVSPYIKVATITIPKQANIDSEKQLNFCENIHFDPWNSMPATRPIGQINRMRKIIYPEIMKFRHNFNNIENFEPLTHDICTSEADAICATPKH